MTWLVTMREQPQAVLRLVGLPHARGAANAFRSVRELRRRGGALPVVLAVAASGPPDRPDGYFAGSDDHSLSPHQMAGWIAYTDVGFQLTTLAGDRFFPSRYPREILAAIRTGLASCTVGRPT